LLYKNFGVTRYGRVAFYDYDEIEYLTACEIRHVPPARTEEEELSGEPWYPIGPKDIFPETFRIFLLNDPRVKAFFLKHHPDFFDPEMWRAHQMHLKAGAYPHFIEYEAEKRFMHRFKAQL
jgi:isocitrate dehydrogenase kinase/phosphatase